MADHTPSTQRESPPEGKRGIRPYRGAAIAATFLAITVLSFGDLAEIIPVFAPFVAGPLFPFVHETHGVLAAMLAIYAAHKLTPAVGTRAMVWFLALHLPYAYLTFPAELPELVRIALLGAAAFLGIYIISLRKRAEERLRLQATALDAAANAILITDREGVIQWVNPAFSRITGFTAEQAIGRTPRILKSGLYSRAFYQTLWDTILAGEVWEAEMVNRRPDGALYHVQQTVTPLRDAQGTITHFVAIQQDITEQKRAEEALKLFRTLIDRSNDAIEVVDPETGRFLDVNEKGCLELGYSREEFLALSVFDVDPMVDPSVFTRAVEELRKSGVLLWEGFHRRKDGSTYPVEVNMKYVRLDRDYIVTVARDITERQRAEAALREGEAMQRLILNNVDEAIYSTEQAAPNSLEGRVRFVSGRAEQILGYQPHEFEDDPALWFSLLHPDDIPAMMEQTAAIFASRRPGTRVYRVRHRHTGEYRWMEDGVTPQLDEAGNVIGTFGVARDITERKQREREREATITVASALRTAPTRADILPVVVDQLLNLLQAEGAALAIQDPFSGDTVIEVARGEFARGSHTRLPLGEGVGGQVISTGQAYLSNDIRSEPRFARPDLLGDVRAVACVPLIVQGRAIGALLIGRKTQIASDDVRLLNAIADITANAIHRATLHEQTERNVQRLTALHTIDTTITASFDLRLTLNVLLDQVTTHLGVDAADMLLLNAPIKG